MMILKNLSRDKILLALVVGILLFLLSFPLEKLGSSGSDGDHGEDFPTVSGDTRSQYQAELERELKALLETVQGAGQVKVMLTVAQGERTIYQTDSTYAQSDDHTDSRTQTILVTDSERNETGLVYQKNPPVYQGAIVLAQGADDPTVKLAIAEAVSDVTGLGVDKISILKMQ